MKKALVKEIFSSIQGEGLCVGEKQLFVRFSLCNLNCAYCDTDHGKDGSRALNIDELFEITQTYKVQTISLTGGEPLLWADFLKDFLKKYKNKLKKIYLETNGTLSEELLKIAQYVDVVAMDIKLKSATKQETDFLQADKMLSVAPEKTFIKIVFDKNIQDDEISKCTDLAKKHNVTIILQPKMPMDKGFEKTFEKFYKQHKNTRLIPQTHKFLNVR